MPDLTTQNNTTAPTQALSQSALLEACKQIEDTTGSCPSDMKGWEHPESCEAHCERGCEVGCWKTYFISLSI